MNEGQLSDLLRSLDEDMSAMMATKGPAQIMMSRYIRSMRKAREAIEYFMNSRMAWRCRVGNGVFTTYDEEIAKEWVKDELDVERFFQQNE